MNEFELKRSTILVVDDVDDNRQLIESHLRKEKDFSVVFAGNGVEAISMFKKQEVSLILMDMEMPVMDGYTAARTIKGFEGADMIPVIAMTAHEGEDEIRKCLKAGCNDYLNKPIKKDSLINIINKYLGTCTKSEKTGGKSEKREDIAVYVDPDLKELIPGFLEKRRKDVEKISQLLDEGNLKEIYVIGHSMSGSGGGYGFDRISKIGKGIEEAARNGNVKDIKRLNNILADYLSAVKVVIRDEG